MATTKIKQIHSTLYSAIDYIMNMDKTIDGEFISCHGCAGDSATVARKMEATLAQATNRNRVTNGNELILAQHIIQSFKPGEVTTEKAHELGQKLADEFLGGRYQFVLCTHSDREHIHNHLIFCNYSLVDKKSFETTRNRGKKSWKDLRKISDKICREHGLSVVTEHELKTTPQYLHASNFAKRNNLSISEKSFRATLKNEIDFAIAHSKSFDDFLNKMRQRGIGCIYNPDHVITLKFRMQGAKKNIRAGGKLMGFRYSEEGIRRRIQETISFEKKEKSVLIDTTTKRMESSPYLKRWAEIQNMKNVSEKLNVLTRKDGTSADMEQARKVIHEYLEKNTGHSLREKFDDGGGRDVGRNER